jgi:hypothetical protein
MMRRLTIAALLFVTACSSSSIVQSNTYVNQPGDPIEISVEGLNVDPHMIEGRDRPFDFAVVVANNSDLDVTVTNVNVFQNSVGGMVADPFSSKYDVTIEPAKEHNFEVKMTARSPQQTSAMSTYSPNIALRVVVSLSNGDRYLQEFVIPIVR